MKKTLYIYIVATLFCSVASAQYTVKQYVKAAEKQINANNPFGAVEYYGMALELDANNTELWYDYGCAAYDSYSYSTTEMAFEKYINELQGENQADAIYKLASTKHQLGKYNEAIQYYNIYNTEYGDDNPDYKMMSEKGVKSAQWAIDNKSDDEDVEVIHLGNNVNTPYSEHAPTMLNDKLHFTSLRFPYGSKKNERFGSKILKNTKGKKHAAITTFPNFNEEEKLTSSAAFTPDGMWMIYSLCNYNATGGIDCQLYKAKNLGDDVFGNATLLSSVINQAGYTATQPTIKMKGDEMQLIFVSDAPGGKGNLDIWSSDFDEEMNFSTPTNLSINTVGDDRTPFYHNPSSTLYFCSNEYDGFGGLDLYKSAEVGDSYGTPENLGSEVNSSFNDIYYFLNDDETVGYIASNRLGSKFLDSKYETCCYDIYEVQYDDKNIELLLTTFDNITKDPLHDTRVVLKDVITGEIIYDSNNPDGNDYTFKIKCDREYELSVFRDGYLSSVENIGPYNDKCGEKTVEEKVYLTPSTIALQVNTFETPGNNPLAGCDVVLIDVETGERVTQSERNATGYKFDILPGKQYKLEAMKGGYTTAYLDLDTTGASGLITKDMYLNKPKPVATLEGLIPVRLYFDNDHPNPRTRATVTDLSYSDTYDRYYERRSTFKQRYDNPSAIDNFFTNDVKGGYDKLNSLKANLIKVLETGQTINLYLRGYASPKFQSDYNIALGNRRVESVRNELRRYNNGMYRTYIDSGQLIITERSFGEDTAATGISDSQTDEKGSVYSPEASRERRVEIDEIKFEN